MKPTLRFEAPLLPNEDQFTAPFFQRFQTRPAAEPLQLNDSVSKNYLFPTFYGDVTCAIGIFLCDYAKAQALLPHPDMRPVSVPGGRAVVTISCYEYKNVMNVPPYNEVAFTIPVLVGAPVSVPVLPLLWGGYPGAGYYVFHMPVTSLENQIRGTRIWGLPKVVEEIEVREEGDECVTSLTNEQGQQYFSLRVPMQGKPGDFDVGAWIYSRRGDQLVRGRTSFQATFQVNKYTSLLWKDGQPPARPYLELGDSPMADTLRGLDMNPQPFQFRFAKHMNAAFDLPDEGYQAPFSFSAQGPSPLVG